MRVDTFLAGDDAALVHRLAHDDMQRFRRNEAQQLRAWHGILACLRTTLAALPMAADWALMLEYSLHRLGRRIDAVLASPRGVFVLEFKIGATRFTATDRRQVEDYALDLQDFHSGSRRHPIIPILIASDAQPQPATLPLLLGSGVAPVQDASAHSLGGVLAALWHRLPDDAAKLDADAWADAPYRPVPAIVDAACVLYQRHGVADIAYARADAKNLSITTEAIRAAVRAAESEQHHVALFVTGIPGAGKTLCGLNAAFGIGHAAGATFLTGNPTLVHVLREALARDAAQGHAGQRHAGKLRAARQKTEAEIQALPKFRDSYVATGHCPAEHVIIIDEAQRSWSVAHAIQATQDAPAPLTDGEPGHLLDIMARHRDWAVIVALVGNGQEIHTGEGGLAEWAAALARRPEWRVVVSPQARHAAASRQRMDLPAARDEVALHLDVPMRSLRNPHAAGWVDALLSGDGNQALALAALAPLPFLLTRDLTAMRGHLRQAARGLRRPGLVASSGARRLRADGLGVELPHMDAKAVARWFLDRWPDVRASDALEQVATEFSCQGLELDYVGLCWGGDLIRAAGGWRARRFMGTRWTLPQGAEAIANRINTYRVLLTRARYETIIWVPQGDPADETRDPREFDAVAAFLLECGAQPLETKTAAAEAAAVPALLL